MAVDRHNRVHLPADGALPEGHYILKANVYDATLKPKLPDQEPLDRRYMVETPTGRPVLNPGLVGYESPDI